VGLSKPPQGGAEGCSGNEAQELLNQDNFCCGL